MRICESPHEHERSRGEISTIAESVVVVCRKSEEYEATNLGFTRQEMLWRSMVKPECGIGSVAYRPT